MNIVRIGRCLTRSSGRKAPAGYFALALLVMVMAAKEGWAAPERPQGTNCHLTAPPKTAGEINAPHEIMFVYPRTKDIGMAYRGCQTVWARADRGDWEVVSLVRIEQRAVVEVWPPPPDGESADHCVYSNGRILPGSPASCGALIIQSFPAGCLARSLEMHIFPSMPKGCEEG
jgi:hypothetical protein